jgi:hypothetical protein
MGRVPAGGVGSGVAGRRLVVALAVPASPEPAALVAVAAPQVAAAAG